MRKKERRKFSSQVAAYKIPDSQHIVSQQIDKILGKNIAIRATADSELELKRELEDPDTNCIHFYDVNQSDLILEDPLSEQDSTPSDQLLPNLKAEQEDSVDPLLVPFKLATHTKFSKHSAAWTGNSKAASHSCVQAIAEQGLVMTYNHAGNSFELSPSFLSIKVVLPDEPKITPKNCRLIPVLKSSQVATPTPKPMTLKSPKPFQRLPKNTFPCPMCAKCFNYSLALKRHLENWHNEVRGLSCPMCNKAFERENFLVRHFETCSVDFC